MPLPPCALSSLQHYFLVVLSDDKNNLFENRKLVTNGDNGINNEFSERKEM